VNNVNNFLLNIVRISYLCILLLLINYQKMNKSYVKGALIALLLGASPVLFAQTGVAINLAGATSPNPAILDLSDASNKNLGFLMTNVALTSINDAVTIPTPTTGMIVWNTNAALPMGVGYYYWSGLSSLPNDTWLYLLNNGTAGGGGGGGSVTSISAGVSGANSGGGLTFSSNPITTTGSIAIANTGVTAGSYGDAADVPAYTVNAQGQITSASNIAISASSIGAVSSVTGTAPIVVTGTTTANVSLEAPQGDVFYGNTGGSTYTTAGAAGSILYNAVASTPSWLTAGATGDVLTMSAGGLPIWSAAGGGGSVSSIGPQADGALANTGASGLYFSSNPITGAGTIGIAVTGVTTGTYGNATNLPVITVNAQGQLTTVTTQTITPAGIGAPSIGTGIVNYIACWTPNATTLGTGVSQDNGSRVAMQTTASAFPAGDLLSVTANATDVTAILGSTTQTTGWGVQGTNSAATGTTGGVYGSSASIAGFGVYGKNSNASGIGVEGINTAANASDPGVGVYGSTNQGNTAVTPYQSGFGVEGVASNASGTGIAGFGNGVGADAGYMSGGSGGYFAGTAIGIGVSESDGTVAGVESSAIMGFAGPADAVGVVGIGNSNAMPAAFMFLPATGSGGAFAGQLCGLAAATYSSAVNSEAILCSNEKSGNDVYIDYDETAIPTDYKILGTAPGSVSMSVQNTKGDYVVMHAPETPECYFEDYGQGTLVNGRVHIDMDPTYAKNICVNEKHPLRVYVQLEGDCKGVYVTNKTTTGFDVVELDGGTSNITFQYHIIGNQADAVMPSGEHLKFADLRFEPTPLPQQMSAGQKVIHAKPVVASNQNSK
jgi:hypothetical protein